jgi:hypothetical protein
LKSIEESETLTHIERGDNRISSSSLISIIRAPPEEAKKIFISAEKQLKKEKNT